MNRLGKGGFSRSRRWPRVLFVRPFGVVGARGVFLEVRRIYLLADFRFLALQRLATCHQDVGFLCFRLRKGVLPEAKSRRQRL